MKKILLLFAVALLSTVSSFGQEPTSPYTGSVVAEGDFYLYNVGTGLWIQNIDANNRRSDNNYNTGAGMGTAGFDFTLTAVDGGYNLDPKENPRKFGWGYGDGGIMYLDGNIGGNTHWDFTSVDGVSNGYKISIDGHVLGVEVSNGKYFLINNATENDVWQLVTRSERLEKMQTIVSDGKPYDLSFLLGDWNFATNNLRRAQWTEVREGGNDDKYPRGKIWNSCHLVWNTNYYSWSQTIAIADLPDGLYQFSVQGMYRDGNRNQVGAKAAAGNTELIAKYFIGSVEGSLMSMLAQAQTTQGDGFETAIENTNPQLYAPDNADNWSIVWALHPDKYWNEPIKVNVRGGSVEVGVRKTSHINGDWIAMNEFKLEYVGPLDLTEYKNTLQAAITAAENYKGQTTGVLADALSVALSEAQAALNSSDIDVIESKTEALNKARTDAEAVDVAILAATIPFAEAEGADVTAANTFIETGTSADELNNILSALRIARRVANAETHANVFAGNAPEAGDFYLYNVGTGRFFCNGDDWGTHASIGFPGIIVTLEGTEGTYKFNTHLQNGDDNGNPKYYLNYGGYCDTWTNDSWVFTEVSTGVYNIARSSDNALLLGYSTSTYNRVDTDKNGADNANNQWKLVTKADRDALLATATEAEPQDASYLIKSPGFSQREDVSAWTFTNASIWGRGDNHSDFTIEAWNQTSAGVEQTVTGLPAGTYELKVQAYYRDGSHEKQAEILAGGGEARQLATLYAGTKSALIQNISGGADKAPGLGTSSSIGYMPNSCDAACLYFQNGLYWASLDEIVVGQDGKMTIGARKTEKLNDGDWMVLDNFRLIYKGAGIDLTGVKADLLAKIGEANDIMDDLDLRLSFLKTAVGNAQDVYDNSTDADEIVDATNAIQTAINQANAALDMSLFLQTMALCEAEGVDVNDTKATVEGVTDGSTFASVVSAELGNLRTARRVNAVDKQPDIFTGSAPKDGGQYYIYNIGAQRYLTGGVDYGTHAAVNFAAQIATFTKNGDGWRIHTNIRTNSDALNTNGFVDCPGDGDTWYLIEVSEGVYNISKTNNNSGATLLGYSGERRGNWWQVDTDNEGANLAINQWKLVSKAERDALLTTASSQNPIDATYYIHAAGFDHWLPDAQMAFPLTKWQTWFPENKGGNNGIGGWEPDFNWECWNSGNIKFYQELSGLKPGKYRLSAQGYYRHGAFEQAVNEFNNPKTDGAILYATNGNDETFQSYLVPITSEVDKAPGYGRNSAVGSFPDDRNETVAQFFEFGLYKNVVNDVIVGNDGKLTIGVEKFENNQGSEWIVVDNFRLTCLGLTGDCVTVGNTGYATYVAPFDLDFDSNVNVSAFAVQKNVGYAHLEPVTTVPAGTAVVVKAENAGTYAVEKTTGAVLGADNDLLASDGSVQGGASIFALAKKNEKVGFYQVDANRKVDAGKGYLVIASPVKAFYPFDEDADAINSLTPALSEGEGAIYNLAGQRLSKMQKGINVVSGKKVLF